MVVYSRKKDYDNKTMRLEKGIKFSNSHKLKMKQSIEVSFDRA